MTQRSVLITGAAAGIGRATALALAGRGWRVGAFDLDGEKASDVAASINLRGPSAVAVGGALDVRDADQWRSVLDQFTASSGGRLDALVNNAGILQSGPFATIPLAAQQKAVETNVTGVINGCHAAYPYLSVTAGAQVVNLCSASAIYGQPELATYSATKFAVRGLSEALDLEWEDDDITVTAIWPLFVATDMVVGMDVGPQRTFGVRLTAEDVAAVIADVLSRTASTRRKGLRLPRSVHRAVGAQARSLLASSAVGPSWLNRLVNRRLAR